MTNVAGAGTISFRVQATHTTKVRFLLSPTGTTTPATLLGEDTTGNDGWTLAWRYPDEPLTAHLTIRAIGPGGTSPDSVLGLSSRHDIAALTLARDLRPAQCSGACSPRLPGVARARSRS